MNKGSKIVVYVIVFIVILVIGTLIKIKSGMAVMSLGGVALYYVSQSLFKKDENKKDNQEDINLKK